MNQTQSIVMDIKRSVAKYANNVSIKKIISPKLKDYNDSKKKLLDLKLILPEVNVNLNLNEFEYITKGRLVKFWIPDKKLLASVISLYKKTKHDKDRPGFRFSKKKIFDRVNNVQVEKKEGKQLTLTQKSALYKVLHERVLSKKENTSLRHLSDEGSINFKQKKSPNNYYYHVFFNGVEKIVRILNRDLKKMANKMESTDPAIEGFDKGTAKRNFNKALFRMRNIRFGKGVKVRKIDLQLMLYMNNKIPLTKKLHNHLLHMESAGLVEIKSLDTKEKIVAALEKHQDYSHLTAFDVKLSKRLNGLENDAEKKRVQTLVKQKMVHMINGEYEKTDLFDKTISNMIIRDIYDDREKHLAKITEEIKGIFNSDSLSMIERIYDKGGIKSSDYFKSEKKLTDLYQLEKYRFVSKETIKIDGIETNVYQLTFRGLKVAEKMTVIKARFNTIHSKLDDTLGDQEVVIDPMIKNNMENYFVTLKNHPFNKDTYESIKQFNEIEDGSAAQYLESKNKIWESSKKIEKEAFDPYQMNILEKIADKGYVFNYALYQDEPWEGSKLFRTVSAFHELGLIETQKYVDNDVEYRLFNITERGALVSKNKELITEEFKEKKEKTEYYKLNTVETRQDSMTDEDITELELKITAENEQYESEIEDALKKNPTQKLKKDANLDLILKKVESDPTRLQHAYEFLNASQQRELTGKLKLEIKKNIKENERIKSSYLVSIRKEVYSDTDKEYLETMNKSEKKLHEYLDKNKVNIYKDDRHHQRVIVEGRTIKRKINTEEMAIMTNLKMFSNLTENQLLSLYDDKKKLYFDQDINHLMKTGILGYEERLLDKKDPHYQDTPFKLFHLKLAGNKLAPSLMDNKAYTYSKKYTKKNQEIIHDLLQFEGYNLVKEDYDIDNVVSVVTDRQHRSNEFKRLVQELEAEGQSYSNFADFKNKPRDAFGDLEIIHEKHGCLESVHIEIDRGYSGKVIQKKSEALPDMIWVTDSDSQAAKIREHSNGNYGAIYVVGK